MLIGSLAICTGILSPNDKKSDILPDLSISFSRVKTSMEDAVRACSFNPAKSIGISDRAGSLEIGKEASIVLLDKETLEIRTIIFQGQIVK